MAISSWRSHPTPRSRLCVRVLMILLYLVASYSIPASHTNHRYYRLCTITLVSFMSCTRSTKINDQLLFVLALKKLLCTVNWKSAWPCYLLVTSLPLLCLQTFFYLCLQVQSLTTQGMPLIPISSCMTSTIYLGVLRSLVTRSFHRILTPWKGLVYLKQLSKNWVPLQLPHQHHRLYLYNSFSMTIHFVRLS